MIRRAKPGRRAKGSRKSAPTPRSAADRNLRSYGRHLIDEDDVRIVGDVLRSDYLTTGPWIARFEQALAKATGAREAVAVSSGTAALHLAVMTAGIGEGDFCVVPSLTFSATANAVRYAGGEVVFADVDPDTGLMRPEDFRDALGRAKGGRVKAVLPVHLAGQTVDMTTIADVARENGLVIIEDACHAIGSLLILPDGKTRPVGNCSHGGMAVFSMHPVKTIAMGEGGAVVTTDRQQAARLRLLRSHGMQAVTADLVGDRLDPQELVELGYNYRASAIHCALGWSQLRKLKGFVAIRRRLRARYRKRLAKLAPWVQAVPEMPHSRAAWHLMVALIDFPGLNAKRGDVMRALAARGIGTQVHYLPVHRQPYYRARYGEIPLPGADRYYERCLSLPLHAGMTEDDVDMAASNLAEPWACGWSYSHAADRRRTAMLHHV